MFEGVDNFSSKVCTETKNSPMQKSFQIHLLNFKSSLIAKEIRVYLLLLSKWWCYKLGLLQKSQLLN